MALNSKTLQPPLTQLCTPFLFQGVWSSVLEKIGDKRCFPCSFLELDDVLFNYWHHTFILFAPRETLAGCVPPLRGGPSHELGQQGIHSFMGLPESEQVVEYVCGLVIQWVKHGGYLGRAVAPEVCNQCGVHGLGFSAWQMTVGSHSSNPMGLTPVSSSGAVPMSQASFSQAFYNQITQLFQMFQAMGLLWEEA